jgi:hypothetical protein
MGRDKLKEPSFIAASMACLLLILLLVISSRSSPASNPKPGEYRELKAEIGELRNLVLQLADQVRGAQAKPTAEGKPKTVEPAEFQEALSRAAEHLDKKNFALAYDFLLVASRLSASDPRLFDAVVKFIDQAKGSQDDEVVALADDLLDRGESLLHFQSPSLVESARKKLADVREGFPTPPNKPEPEPRSESIRRLIQVSTDKCFQVELRSKAAERARNALEEASIDSALASRDQGGDMKFEEIEKLQKQTNEAERLCVAELFERYQPSALEWLRSSRKLIDEGKAANSGELTGISEKIEKAVSQGMDRLQEILPYAKSEIEVARKLSSELEQRVGYLHRWKSWLYNRSALAIVRDAESNQVAAELRIQSLAKIDEGLLAPYVMQKYNEVWTKVFDGLDEEKKVQATRWRVLRTIE